MESWDPDIFVEKELRLQRRAGVGKVESALFTKLPQPTRSPHCVSWLYLLDHILTVGKTLASLHLLYHPFQGALAGSKPGNSRKAYEMTPLATTGPWQDSGGSFPRWWRSMTTQRTPPIFPDPGRPCCPWSPEPHAPFLGGVTLSSHSREGTSRN